MADSPYDRVVKSGDRAVEGPASRVVDDRVLAAATPPAGGASSPATAPPAPALDPPVPVIAFDPGIVPDPALQSCLEKIRDLKVGNSFPYKTLRMALIDATTPQQQWYAGVNDQIQTQVDDIARLGLMFAAFQLRDLMSTAVDGIDASSGRDALQQIETSWQSVWEKRFPNRKSDAVKYDRIFEVFPTGPKKWAVKFKSDLKRDDGTLNGIAAAGSGENIDFTSRLKLMLNWMDNPAARGIQRDLGFQCVNALLEDGGFFDARYGGGIWLSKLYGANEVWGGGDPVSGKSVQGVTARAVAEMMILIGRHKLIRFALTGEIVPLMSSSVGSQFGPMGWFVNAVDNATDPDAPVVPGAAPPKRSLDFWLSVFSGIGSRFNECVLIRRPDPFGRFLQYVAVILNAPNSTVIEQVAVKLDDCIRAKYPPPPPPPSPTTA